jgi:hypothetical protein
MFFLLLLIQLLDTINNIAYIFKIIFLITSYQPQKAYGSYDVSVRTHRSLPMPCIHRYFSFHHTLLSARIVSPTIFISYFLAISFTPASQFYKF